MCVCVCVNQLKIEIGIETDFTRLLLLQTHIYLCPSDWMPILFRKSYLNGHIQCVCIIHTYRYIRRSVDRMSARPAIVNVLYEFWANTSFNSLIHGILVFSLPLPRNIHFMKNWDDNRQACIFNIQCNRIAMCQWNLLLPYHFVVVVVVSSSVNRSTNRNRYDHCSLLYIVHSVVMSFASFILKKRRNFLHFAQLHFKCEMCAVCAMVVVLLFKRFSCWPLHIKCLYHKT